MVISFSILGKCNSSSPCLIAKIPKPFSKYKLHLRHCFDIASQEILLGRRHTVLCSAASLVAILAFRHGFAPLPVKAEESDRKENENEADQGILDSIKSLLDPNEKTKSGKVLPKSYLKSAREVVKTLRESLKEDARDIAKFRRMADAAKESIREYLSGWKGQKAVVAEESYAALEKVIRSLANFYSKAGPFAALPEEVKSNILDDLNTAEAFL
ncbi:photosystem II D1 precursor processing protein PSB27-H2, chloroplastic [Magnolia sinica]|uniref:photosystem II D1 precursor processing protein PSB27-H2, chloroplastic n=1 Tax=Magnolia sinica TaxID=86752 RepID=UPI00265A598A|nr:photosystem II D1 precursor processing protein PSB27-H2, chloroplastic [Magnolia sinica]